MTGRKPVPTALKIVRGNPGKRPLNEREPEFELGADRPEELSPAGAEVWNDLAPQLEASGVLTAPDRYILAAFCEAVARFWAAHQLESERGSYIEQEMASSVNRVDLEGNPLPPITRTIIAPWTTERRQSQVLIAKLGAELGLTPASRSRVQASKSKKKENPFTKLEREYSG